MSEISASVGKDGTNKLEDVLTVQRLLLQRGFRLGTASGRCDDLTLVAITTFQGAFMRKPDGRIDPGGMTWKKLCAAGPAPVSEGNSLTKKVELPARSTYNTGLVAVSNTLMTKLFGAPRESYSTDCQPVTNARLKKHMTTASVGPFRSTGLKPAVESLTAVMREIQAKQPAVYSVLGTAGMLCARYVRGSTSSISNHSWGTAVDLTLSGVLDKRGDNRVQYGLTLIAPIFNSFGWYWGAGFRTEDAMHFEAGRALVESWESQVK